LTREDEDDNDDGDGDEATTDGRWSMVDGGREVLWRVDKVTDVLYRRGGVYRIGLDVSWMID